MAVGELRVRALGSTVGGLHRSEEVLLEPVRVVLVELLVRRSEFRQPKPDLIDRKCQGVEQFLPCFRARVRHVAETSPGRQSPSSGFRSDAEQARLFAAQPTHYLCSAL